MEGFETIAVDRMVLNEAEVLAQECGLPVEQILSDALQQGITGIRAMRRIRARMGKGNLTEALALLQRAGNGRAPDPGDEIPADVLALYPEFRSR